MIKYRLALVGISILALLSFTVYVLYAITFGWILWIFLGDKAFGEGTFIDEYAYWIRDVKEDLKDKLED